MNTWDGMKPIRAVDFLIVHCADTYDSMDIGVIDIDRWHKERGWAGVGYHFVIRRNGVVEKGRPETIPGAHARGVNHLSLGICMVGGKADKGHSEDNFTPQQWNSLRVLVQELIDRYPSITDENGAPRVVGHRDVDDRKQCPSFDVGAWLAREGFS